MEQQPSSYHQHRHRGNVEDHNARPRKKPASSANGSPRTRTGSVDGKNLLCDVAVDAARSSGHLPLFRRSDGPSDAVGLLNGPGICCGRPTPDSDFNNSNQNLFGTTFQLFHPLWTILKIRRTKKFYLAEYRKLKGEEIATEFTGVNFSSHI